MDNRDDAATAALVLDTAERVFRATVTPALREQAAAGEFPQPVFAQLQQQGLFEVALPGNGLPDGLMFELLQLTGRYAAPGPIAEHLLATRWLGRVPSGVVSVASSPAWVEGTAVLAPWGREATSVLVVAGALPDEREPDQREPDQGEPDQGEPDPADVGVAVESLPRLSRQRVEPVAVVGLRLEPVDAVVGVRDGSVSVAAPMLNLALTRAALMSGALQSVLALTVSYAQGREQFGRPLARFQAIQHQLACLAAEVAAAKVATDCAIAALGTGAWPEAVAAAKIRAGQAAGVAAEIAHQVHGAMGYTREHELHQFTMRLLTWRDDYGHEAEWQRWLADRLLRVDADALWATLVD